MPGNALALSLTTHGKVAAQEKDVADFLPYTRHVDAATIATKITRCCGLLNWRASRLKRRTT